MKRMIVVLAALLLVWMAMTGPARTTTEVCENRRHEGRWYTSVIVE